MFALEINFHDGVSTPEILLVRRPHAIIGSSDYAHVVIEGSASNLYGVRLVRGLGREFRCQPLSKTESNRGVAPFQEGVFTFQAELNLGDVTTHITSLDIDMQLQSGESPDRAGVRILRRALTTPAPEFPAVAVLGTPPLFLSFPPDEPVLVGRSRRCGLRLDAADVSSEHARVGFEDGRFWVEDLGSTNGTYVDGERISGRRFLEGDETILVGAEFTIVGIRSKNDLAALGTRPVPRESDVIDRQQFPCLVSNSELVRPERVVLTPNSKVSIGRDPANEIWIGASHVSRNHAEIESDENGRLSVTDTSSNGTSMNGERLPRGIKVDIVPGLSVFDVGGGVTFAMCSTSDDEEQYLSRRSDKGLQRAGAQNVVLGTPVTLNAAPVVNGENDPASTVFYKQLSEVSGEAGNPGGVFEKLAQRASARSTHIKRGDDEQGLPESGVPLGASGEEGVEIQEFEEFDEYPTTVGRLGKFVLWLVVVALVLVVLGLFVWVVGGESIL